MGTVHNLASALVTEGEQRVAPRLRVLMRASLRMRGNDQIFAVTIKDISSTGLRANAPVSMFPGANVEIELPNIGWTPGQVVRADEGVIGVRFAAIIDPARAQAKVTGSYGPPPSPSTTRLLRV